MQGHKDRHLTELGRSQAEATARWFAETRIHVDHLCTSPLIRARETAEFSRPVPAILLRNRWTVSWNCTPGCSPIFLSGDSGKVPRGVRGVRRWQLGVRTRGGIDRLTDAPRP